MHFWIDSNDSSFDWSALTDEPEHGPGYQLVTVPDQDGEVDAGDYLVFNCEFFFRLPDLWNKKLGQLDFGPPAASFADWAAAFIRARTAKYIRTLPQLTVLPQPGAPGPRPTIPVMPTPRGTLLVTAVATAADTLWRLSAYNPDRRITAGLGLQKGTYVISDADKALTPSGFAAVGRYALPSPFPAVNAWPVNPKGPVKIYIGTVRPAYGQAGGGSEGVVDTACPPGSVGIRTTLALW